MQARSILPKPLLNAFDTWNPPIPGITFSVQTLCPLISQMYMEKIVSDMHLEQSLKDFELDTTGRHLLVGLACHQATVLACVFIPTQLSMAAVSKLRTPVLIDPLAASLHGQCCRLAAYAK